MSGANVQWWTNDFNGKMVSKETYSICLDGIIIPDLSLYGLYGAGLSLKAKDNGFQIIISNNACAYRYWQGASYTAWKSF